MTTGSRISLASPLYLGNTGFRENTTWTGEDAPTVVYQKTRKPLYKREKRIVMVPNKDRRRGKSYLVPKEVSFSVLKKPGTLSNRPLVPVKRKGEHSYSKSSLRWFSYPVTCSPYYGYQTKGSDWVWATLGGDRPLVPLLDSNDENRLISKLWTRVKGSDFNAANFLGESHQTLALVANSAIRVAKAYFHLRQGDAAGMLRSLVEGTSRAPLMKRLDPAKVRYSHPNLSSDSNQMASLLLEVQYGWRPLVSDVIAGAEMLSHHLNTPFTQNIQTVKVRRVGPDKRVVSQNFWARDEAWFGPGGITFPRLYVHGKTIKAIFTEKDIPSLPATLGLTNLEVTAYELTPFSFLADWFLPIGPWLEARAAAQNLTGTFVISEHLVDAEYSGIELGGSLATVIDHCNGSFVRFTTTRTVTNSLTAAKPSYKPLNKALSMEHCINALGLVVGAATMPLGQLRGSIMRNNAVHSRLFS